MRKRIWLLASCGIVGMGFGLAAADAPPANPADDFAAASLTDPVATSPKDDAKPAVAKQPTVKSAASSSRVVNADQVVEASDVTATTAKQPKLIHAEYRTQAGTGDRAKVRLVGGTAEANPFDDPIDATAKIEKPAPSAAPAKSAEPAPSAAPATPSAPIAAATPAEAAPHSSRSTRAALSDAASSGGHDATQAPLVTVHWEKKSPLAVGQECHCDLVIKNTGKLAASDVSVEAYFPATVRLTHSDPMPSDNQDHVTWSFSSLAGGEEKVVHVTMVPGKRGESGDDRSCAIFGAVVECLRRRRTAAQFVGARSQGNDDRRSGHAVDHHRQPRNGRCPQCDDRSPAHERARASARRTLDDSGRVTQSGRNAAGSAAAWWRLPAVRKRSKFTPGPRATCDGKLPPKSPWRPPA